MINKNINREQGEDCDRATVSNRILPSGSKGNGSLASPGEPFSLVTTMEIWKPIPGSNYEASSLGRIRSPWRTLKLCAHPLGYQIVGIRFDRDPRVRTYTVHSLVALAFHGPRPEGLDVAHGNCVKTDNRPSNLRYCTRSENMLDSVMIGTKMGGAGPKAYPWQCLDIGESFKANPVARASIVNCAWYAGRRTGRSYKVSAPANDDGSWTVTRVA